MDKVCIYHLLDSILSKKLAKDVIQEEIKTKFEEIGVSIRNLKFIGNEKYFESCVIDISQVKLKKIWGRRLGISECSCISYQQNT